MYFEVNFLQSLTCHGRIFAILTFVVGKITDNYIITVCEVSILLIERDK